MSDQFQRRSILRAQSLQAQNYGVESPRPDILHSKNGPQRSAGFEQELLGSLFGAFIDAKETKKRTRMSSKLLTLCEQLSDYLSAPWPKGARP